MGKKKVKAPLDQKEWLRWLGDTSEQQKESEGRKEQG